MAVTLPLIPAGPIFLKFRALKFSGSNCDQAGVPKTKKERQAKD
jgi:hypothetical protein